MSTNFNKRRGAKADKPRKVRVCRESWPMFTSHINNASSLEPCSSAVRPDRNGNRCEEHRK